MNLGAKRLVQKAYNGKQLLVKTLIMMKLLELPLTATREILFDRKHLFY